jgi:transcriptional regulator with XRE-family HTH domain
MQMGSIGRRLRGERVRLGYSQRALADIGGVQANAQGNYESDLRIPRADYLALVSEIGVDILYVVIGHRTPLLAGDKPISQAECFDP